MWLLNTETLELRFFNDSKEVRYVALSHVWEPDDHLQPFQEIQAIHSRCLASGEDPRELVTAKVRDMCSLAASAQYDWVWIDTCCIDKTSSAELSEAINSMYRWYGDSFFCYVYLADVSDDDDPFIPGSEFRSSRWHTRGWTLQELIAPTRVRFFTKSWHSIGTKSSLAAVLQEVTGVDMDVLLWQNRGWLSNVSVARRMSWASKRTTTRPEDRSYSLMGIFGVNLPIIYGEGSERAFMRLQMGIMRLYADQSIFAWGPIHPNGDIALANVHCPRSFTAHPGRSPTLREDSCARLLASSPTEFASSANFRPIDPRIYAHLFGELLDTNYTITGHSAILRLPLTSDRTVKSFAAVHAAALACSVDKTSIVLLFLTQPRETNSLSTCSTSSRFGNAAFTLVGARIVRNPEPSGSSHELLDDTHADSFTRWVLHDRQFYRGVVLQLPCPLGPYLLPGSRSPPHLRAALSYFSLREVRIEMPPILHVGDRNAQWAILQPHQHTYGVRAPTNAASRPWLLFHVHEFVLRSLERRYGFVVDSPHTKSRHESTFMVGMRYTARPSMGPPTQLYLSITFVRHLLSPARRERLTLYFGIGCECFTWQLPAAEFNLPHIQHLWMAIAMSTIACGSDSDVAGTLVLMHKKADYDYSSTQYNLYSKESTCRWLHLLPEQKHHSPMVHYVGGGRAVHVRCPILGTSRHATSPSPTYEFGITINLVGFEETAAVIRDPSHTASPVDAETAIVEGPGRSSPPDTFPPRRHGGHTWLTRTRQLLPTLMSGLARPTYAANRFLRAGLRGATEWLGKEADYTCGQPVWDEWAVGGA